MTFYLLKIGGDLAQCLEGFLHSFFFKKTSLIYSSIWVFFWHKLKSQLQKNPKYNQPGRINATIQVFVANLGAWFAKGAYSSSTPQYSTK